MPGGTMDELDDAIITELRKDSRTPFLQIARQLKVSEGTIRKRVSRLSADSIIRRFTIETIHDTAAIVGIETDSHMLTKGIAKSLKELGIDDIFEVTGRFDIICKLTGENMEDINDLLESIRQTNGVVHTETFTVLKED
ncbi:AsnC family transcriptional regulator [Candidatus Woesearchaeota archaeon]|nr:AsnC family transcriptional regulator [Candidatus Woesearchaeota archaeon]